MKYIILARKNSRFFCCNNLNERKKKMKNILKKGSKFFLSALVILNSFMNIITVHAEETTTENDLDTITELGYLEDVFPDQIINENDTMMTDTTSCGTRYAMIYIENQYGFDYISHLYVGDKTVFCIEPMQLFIAGNDYIPDSAKWDELSESQRQAIWEINYYGYSYPGHESENYYVATQIMIWQVVTGNWYQPYYMDGTTTYDISNEMNEINNLRSTPQGRPSFNNQTIKMGLNTPVTLTDSKGTLSNYSITSGNGVNASVNGNDLTVSITSENYDKTLTFSRNFGARDVNIIYSIPCALYELLQNWKKRSKEIYHFDINPNSLMFTTYGINPYDDRLVLKHLDQTTLNLKLPRHTLAGLKFFSSKTSPDGRHYRDIYYYEHNDISFNQIGLTAKEKAVKINKEFTKSMKKELPDKDKKDAVDLVKQLSEDKNIRKKLLMKLLEIESGE